jgi:hypothetical protein
MPPDHSADVKFEIGHVSFSNIVGYWKLLIDERDVTCLKTDVIGRSKHNGKKETLWPSKINLQIQSTE